MAEVKGKRHAGVTTDDERLTAFATRKIRRNYSWTAADEREFRQLAKRLGQDTHALEMKALFRKCYDDALMLGVLDEDPFPAE